MAEGGRRGAERLEQLDLRRGVGDVVLAAMTWVMPRSMSSATLGSV